METVTPNCEPTATAPAPPLRVTVIAASGTACRKTGDKPKTKTGKYLKKRISLTCGIFKKGNEQTKVAWTYFARFLISMNIRETNYDHFDKTTTEVI